MMSKGVRIPEKAFGIAMWVVSVILAGFIVGLGNLVIGDLPQVTQEVSQEQFVDNAASQKILRRIVGNPGANRGD